MSILILIQIKLTLELMLTKEEVAVPKLTLPQGYLISWSGQFENMVRVKDS